jgi:hypothetical protein
MYEKLIAQGKSKSSAARISNAAWRKRNAKKLKKHRPGGEEHEQDRHGDWAEDSGEVDLGEFFGGFGDEVDATREATRNPLPGGGGQGDPISEPITYQGAATLVSIEGDRTTGDDAIVKGAVDRFESQFPDMLPENMTVRFARDDNMNRGAAAWVSPFTDPDVVVINREEWLNNVLITKHLNTREAYEGISFQAALSVPDDQKVSTYLEAVLVHEMAHTVAAGEGFQWEWPVELPSYTMEWYEFPRMDGDPDVPSTYALVNPPEFFAEAMAEFIYEGSENASFAAMETVEVMQQHFNGQIDLSPDAFEVSEAQRGYADFLLDEAGLRDLLPDERTWIEDYTGQSMSDLMLDF